MSVFTKTGIYFLNPGIFREVYFILQKSPLQQLRQRKSINLVSAPQELAPIMKIMDLPPTELLTILEMLFLRIFFITSAH